MLVSVLLHETPMQFTTQLNEAFSWPKGEKVMKILAWGVIA